MTKTTAFLGKFVYQADVIRPRHRTPERFDVVGQTEYRISAIERADLTPRAAAVRAVNERGRLDEIVLDGWNGCLWSPLDRIQEPADRVMEGRRRARVTLSLTDYRAGFLADWIGDAKLNFIEDPLRRAYDATLAPPLRGAVVRYPRPKTTIEESGLVGEIAWSNRGDALRRHAAAMGNLLVVDGAVYARALDPVVAIRENDHKGRRGCITVPRFWVNSDGDVMPQSHDGVLLRSNEVFRADRIGEALAGGLPAGGEIVALDSRFLSRDDDAWTLFCRLDAVLDNAAEFFRFLPPKAVAALKSVSDTHRAATSLWDVAPLSERRSEIMAELKVIADAMRSGAFPVRKAANRDYALRHLDEIMRQCRPAEALHPDDEKGLADLAMGGSR